VKPVLVDTSVWRRFFAGVSTWKGLRDLLDEDGMVLIHPFILGELVLGGLSEREEELFRRLPAARTVADEEVLAMVKRRALTRRGIGWVDAHLLASALASSVVLWSADKKLAAAAQDLGAAFAPAEGRT
jgi:predicted nucleic acid-binding protein